MDELLRDFLTETHESLDVVDTQLVQFEQEPNNAAVLGNIFRLVHTIKGTCGFIGLPRLEALTHAAESLIGKFRDGGPVTGDAVTLILRTIDRIKDILDGLEAAQAEPAGNDDDVIAALHQSCSGEAGLSGPVVAGGVPFEGSPAIAGESASVAGQSIRVDIDTIEHLMTMVSELVLTRNQLLELSRKQDDPALHAPLQRLSNVTSELQSGVMRTRMQPIGKVWRQLPRLVRDLGSELGKEIELEMQGEATRLDRQVLELIKGPLTHMVRNCADHGIEAPAERIAAGKPAVGTIRLSARQESGHILVAIDDDGRGLDTGKIKAKAAAQRLADDRTLAAMNDAQVHALIFAPGFSTADHVTAVSGRGVGMDVVRSQVEQIGGAIEIRSDPGAGMCVTIRIPLTLAIMPALIVEAGGERFAIPQLAVVEIVRPLAVSEHRIEKIGGGDILRLRDRLMPLIGLAALLELPALAMNDAGSGFVVVMQVGELTFGLVVDGVAQAEEIVVKPLSARLCQIGVLSGATIMGDGAVILILDPAGLAKTLGHLPGADADHASRDKPTTPDPLRPLLIFRAGSMQPRAALLESITRIEKIAVDAIETLRGRSMIQYRGRLIPVERPDGVKIRQAGTQPLLIVTTEEQTIGLLIDEIDDIVEQKLEIEIAGVEAGSLGSAVIKGCATDVLDVAHYLKSSGREAPERRARYDRGQVLLVDESEFFRKMLSATLVSAGYRVSQAIGGVDALGLLQDDHFDVVIVATDMTDTDGSTLVAMIRSDTALAGVSVITLSPMVLSGEVERSMQAGVHAHVAKFDRAALVTALDQCTTSLEQAA